MAQLGALSADIASKYTVENNSLCLVAKAALMDKIQAEIGDTKQADFLPQTKMMRWDNEVNFSMRLVHDEPSPDVSTEKEKIIWIGKKLDCAWYEKEEGYEFEVILKELPKSNVLEFSMQTKGLDFFYQGELTQEEIDMNAIRPDNVVGSYAVYYRNCPLNRIGGQEYKAGKAFHIFRPEAIDANGKRAWCDLLISPGLMTITVPQKFLDDAAYPVVIDPTLGYTTVGGTEATFTKDSIRNNIYTMPENGDVSSVSIYQRGGSSRFRGVIALSSDKSLVTYGSEVAGTAGNSIVTSNVTSASLSNAVDYRVGMWLGAVNTQLFLDSGLTLYRDNVTYHATNSPPNPIVDDASVANYKLTMYATYTATGGAARVPQLTTMGIGA